MMRDIIKELHDSKLLKIISVANYGIVKHYTDDDKMEGMDGCSTCCMFNDFCRKMQSMGKDCICSNCFAKSMANSFGWMNVDKDGNDKYYVAASKAISSRVYLWDEIPFLTPKNKFDVFRIESFGEIINLNHAVNLVNLIAKNPHINFGWWSKRPDMIDRALKKCGFNAEWLRDRANIIYSVPFINCIKDGKKYNYAAILKKYAFIKGVFIVYDADFAYCNNITINCGYKKCIECLNCYTLHNDIFVVNEIIKRQQKRYRALQDGTKKPKKSTIIL